MKRYFTRALKFAIYFFALLLICLLIIFFMSKDVMKEGSEFVRLFIDGRFLWMLLTVMGFGAIYPFIGFGTIKILLNKPISSAEEKKQIVELFNQRRYQLVSDNDDVMCFRPKSKINRFTRMQEDTLELDYSESPLELSGLRKDIYKFKFALESFAMQNNNG